MDFKPHCDEARKYVRVTDPTDQRTWEVWCEPGRAAWRPEHPDNPDAWVVQGPDGFEVPIDMAALTIEVLVRRLSTLLGTEETAREVLELFDPLVDRDGFINPSVYVPRDCL